LTGGPKTQTFIKCHAGPISCEIICLITVLMPRKNTKKNNNNKSRKQPASKRSVARAPSTLDAYALAYRRLLRDPCNAPMVPAVGYGPTSGLLVRQRYIITPEYGQAVNNRDFVAVFSPAKGTLRHQSAGANSWKEEDLETGILASTVCRAYRPVAACMKWIPNGSIMDRSGLISVGYVLDEVDSSTNVTGANVANWQTLCTKTESNTGHGDNIEARWMPSGPEDLEFRSRGVTYNADTGTVLLVGRSVDYTSGGTSYANGILEVTVVWEWLPNSGAGIVSPVQTGSSSTLQAVFASIGNLASFALESAPMRQMAGRVAAYGMQRAFNYSAGPALLMA